MSLIKGLAQYNFRVYAAKAKAVMITRPGCLHCMRNVKRHVNQNHNLCLITAQLKQGKLHELHCVQMVPRVQYGGIYRNKGL